MANGRNNRTERRPERSAPRAQGSGRPPRRTKKRTGAQRRLSRSGVLLRLLTMLIIVAVFLLGMAIFFRVTEIQVTGNQMYSAEEVAEASGLEKGDNLMTMNKGAAAGRITALLPYIEAVRVRRVLPGTVVIDVEESDAVYAVASDDGTSWLMNGSGKLLEQADVSAAGYPKLTGITAQSPKAGSQIVCEQTENLEAAMTVMRLLESTDFISQVAEIQVEKTYDIVVWLGTKFEVRLGGTDEMEYKMQYLAAILDDPQIEGGGVIDLTLEEKSVAIFKAWNNSQDLSADSGENSAENS